MAFLRRIGNKELEFAFTQFRRRYIQLPHASSFNSVPKTLPLQIPRPCWASDQSTAPVSNIVRFFAAPAQFQSKWKKEEEDDTDGPRLNDQITAAYVRLVVDDGHSIVSRFEALDRAKKLKLDLVEVQRDGKPPVCKIMDYHKEIFKKQEQLKERAKSKLTLKKGECKEVRFSEKTETKDLKMKADMVKKLMEKGYRVKCKATGSESKDTTAALSRLHALIEDITVVESGPSLAKKEAYMIVRHIKYGPAKKGGTAAHKFQDAADMALNAQEGDTEMLATSSGESIEYENQSSVESRFQIEEEVYSDKHIPPLKGGSHPAEPENRYKKADPLSENRAQSHAQVLPTVAENRYRRVDHPSENNAQSHVQVPPPAAENRYKRPEPRNRFQQTTSNNAGMNNRGPGPRDASQFIPSMNHTRQVPTDIGFNPRTQYTNQTNTPASRYSRPSHPSAPNTPRSGYGVFTTPKGPETQGGIHKNREDNSHDSSWHRFGQDSR